MRFELATPRGRSCFQDRSPRQWEPLQQMSGAGIEPAASASSARRCYQLSYPGQTGRLGHGPDWTRTSNLAVKSHLHCQFVLQTQSAAERNRTSTPRGALRFECSASACSATTARKRAMGLEPMTLARQANALPSYATPARKSDSNSTMTQSGRWDSNPRHWLGRPGRYHLRHARVKLWNSTATMPALSEAEGI